MANPIRNRNSSGTPPVSFYEAWINGRTFKWPNDPSLTHIENIHFRDQLKLSVAQEGAVAMADNFFRRIRKCTPEQLATLQKCLAASNYHLDLNSLDAAISDMGENGSLAKIHSLFPNLGWQNFKDYLGVHEAFSKGHMLNYATDVLAWHRSEYMSHPNVNDQTLMLASLQQCPLDVDKVASVMKDVLGNGIENFDVIRATDHVISLIYDLTPYTAKDRAKELAGQFTLLHKGWGIAYPVALVVQLAREMYNKSFAIPEVGMLGYSAALIDVQVARVFDNTYVVKKKEDSAVSMARLVQSLCDIKDRFQFCVEGAAVFSPKVKTASFDVEGSLFQDVGQP